MVARMSRYAGPADRLDEFVGGLQKNMETLQQFRGFAGAYMLVDDATGDAVTVTLWDSREAEAETAQRADRWRQDAARSSEHSVESVTVLDVAVEIAPAGGGPEIEGAIV